MKRTTAYAAVYLLWGGAYLAVRVLVHVLPPFLIAGLRYSVAASLLLPLLCLRRFPAIPGRALLNACWTGIVMLGVGYGTIFWAEKYLPSWLVAVLMSTSFLWTYLGETLVLRSYPLRPAVLVPLAAGLAGLTLLVKSESQRGSLSVAAMCAVLLAAGSWSAGALAIKRVRMPDSFVQTTILQLGTCGVSLLCISFAMQEWRGLRDVQQIFGWRPILAFSYLVIAASMLGMAAFHWLMKREAASLVATSAYVNPAVAVFVGWGVGHEHLSAGQLLGAVVVLVSVVAVWKGREEAKERWHVRSDCIKTSVSMQ